MKDKLIEDWRSWWKFLSVRAAALLVVLEMADLIFSHVEQIPMASMLVESPYYQMVKLLVAVLIPLLRLWKQADLR
jgi:hypothetical protein